MANPSIEQALPNQPQEDATSKDDERCMPSVNESQNGTQSEQEAITKALADLYVFVLNMLTL